MGPHFCLGQALARIETVVALQEMIRRFPRMERAGEVRWRPNLTFLGMERLSVRLG
jgi:cytochrome P450